MSSKSKRGLSKLSQNVVRPSDSAQVSAPNKKPRKKPVTAKSLGLTKEEFDRIKPAPVRKALKAIVKTLARQVNADWHDGWEEQAETTAEWFEALEAPLQAVLDVGVGKGKALGHCNDVLNIVADSYSDLLACPCRCDTRETLCEMGREFTLVLPWGGKLRVDSRDYRDAWSYVWVALLRVHSNLDDADETLLLRCIRDASDNMTGTERVKLPGVLFNEDADNYDERDLKDGDGAPDGKELARLVEDKASEWKALPTTKKSHPMRRAIDRRFDGTPERRTRDYHLRDSDDEEDQCVVS